MTPHAPSTPAADAHPAGELPKAYRPADHEPGVWQRWIDAGVFRADPGRVLREGVPPYSIVIPPPNVTDRLHLGHALNNTLQDILTRAHRMMGHETLWMPGTDHAGIATQAVVERRILKEEKKRRTDFSREAFIERIQVFKDEYEGVITGQLKAMGCSCDWDRQRFTMDETCARAVREAFFRFFRDGLIYRGKRLVNWDPALQTAVADDECYDQEVETSFWYLRYPLVHPHPATTQRERREGKLPDAEAVPITWNELEARGYPGAEAHPGDEPAWITVATTRPETYLGDSAVAVNPHDPRAKALHGLCVELPLVGRLIPVIEDSYVVLPKAMARTEEEAADPKAEFATGFLKVTPAHDPNDYDLYQRHKAVMDTFAGGAGRALINVLAPDGTISDRHGWSDPGDARLLVGKKRDEARALVEREFSSRGLLEAKRPYRHTIKHSDRSKAVIEPYLSDQWYVRVTDPKLASSANQALSLRKPLRFFPDRYTKTYELWHENIRDWCISRQLWWGHRIPVWSAALDAAATRAELVRLGAAAGSAGEFTTEEADASGRPVAVTRLVAHADGTSTVFCCIAPGQPELEAQAQRQGLTQDPDVLDTWFSSALWPMSTMGWPDDTPLLRAFNPTSTLCTAREIITLWVSRMVMFNRYLMPADWPADGPSHGHADGPTASEPGARSAVGGALGPWRHGQGKGPPPFAHVFIHAVIQDGNGQKMSKSLGNGVDPLDIIASHGADAMRFTLCQMTTQTQDVRMPVVKDPVSGRNTSPKFDFGRNFCNKLWNAARFVQAMLQSPDAPGGASAAAAGGPVGVHELAPIDRWMLSRLAAATGEATAALKAYEFSEYAQSLYDLLWQDFCDWYLEGVKPTVAGSSAQRAVLAHALEVCLRLLHPVIPFVTEAIFAHVRTQETRPIQGVRLDPPRIGGLLCAAGWPVVDPALRDADAESQFATLQELVGVIREARAQHGVNPKRRITLQATPALAGLIGDQAGLVQTLAGLASITSSPPSGASVACPFRSQELRLSDLADAIDPSAERARLSKLIAEMDRSIATLESRLANPGYADRAPPAMVQQTRDQLAKTRGDRALVQEQLDRVPAEGGGA